MRLNLHAIAAKAVNLAHPNVRAVLYRNTGQNVMADGSVKPDYAAGANIIAQMQPEGASSMYHANRVGMEEVNRKFYLHSDSEPATCVASIVRAFSRGGDMLVLEDGSWWLVDEVLEDFTRSGWACVRATLQVSGPEL